MNGIVLSQPIPWLTPEALIGFLGCAALAVYFCVMVRPILVAMLYIDNTGRLERRAFASTVCLLAILPTTFAIGVVIEKVRPEFEQSTTLGLALALLATFCARVLYWA